MNTAITRIINTFGRGAILLKKLKSPRFMGKIDKRLRFVISTLIMTGLMLVSTFFFFDTAWIFIPLLMATVFFLTYFSVLEGIEGVEWATLFIMPVLFTIAAYLFYNLFPVRWLTRIPFIAAYAISLYAILLTSNIFNVGAEKSIQLYRAAFSVNYFYQALIAFLAFNILLSIRENFLINALFAGGVALVLSLQFFWSIKLTLTLDPQHILFSGLVGIVLAEAALLLSFIPFTQTVFALILTAIYYSLAGLVYSYLDARLFRQTVREYIAVLVGVFIIGILTLKW